MSLLIMGNSGFVLSRRGNKLPTAKSIRKNRKAKNVLLLYLKMDCRDTTSAYPVDHCPKMS